MSKLMLLIWISLIVILNVRGDGSLNDPKIICQHCIDKALPDCSAVESLANNFTIYCPQAIPQIQCVIAIVESHDRTNGTDIMCFLKEPIEILDYTFPEKQVAILLEEVGAAITTDLPMQNTIVEKVILDLSEQSDTNSNTEAVRTESQLIEAINEVTTLASDIYIAKNSQETISTVDKELTNIDNNDDMAMADQPMMVAEAKNEQPTEIEDNKIEEPMVVEKMSAETPKLVEEKNDADSQMNTIEVKAEAEPKMMMLTCFGCQSLTESNCLTKPTRIVSCKTAEVGTNGCYTLLKVEYNMTTRGCISDLTTEGIDYCKANKNLCILCYEDGCNNLSAPSGADRKITKLGFILAGLLYIL